MKYRLLKTLGEFEAGCIFEVKDTREPGNLATLCLKLKHINGFGSLPAELAQDPDWFEEVKPFQPEVHEQFFFITPAFDVDSAKVQPNDMYDLILNAGNCFRTEADAESCAAELRKTLAAWKEAHE